VRMWRSKGTCPDSPGGSLSGFSLLVSTGTPDDVSELCGWFGALPGDWATGSALEWVAGNSLTIEGAPARLMAVRIESKSPRNRRRKVGPPGGGGGGIPGLAACT
jgi:hypothetical protein